MELVEPATEILSHLGVERPERLVQEQHFRAGSEGASQRDALALAAGQLLRVPIGEPRHLDELEQLLHADVPRLLRLLPDPEAEGDVLRDGHVPEQGVVLEDEPDLALLHALGGDLLVTHHDPAGRGALQARDNAQHRALARSGRAEQRGDRAGTCRERHVRHRLEVAEALRQVLHHDRRAHTSMPPAASRPRSVRLRKPSITTSRTTEIAASARATT